MTSDRNPRRRRRLTLRGGGAGRGRQPDHYDSLPENPSEDFDDLNEEGEAEANPNDGALAIVDRIRAAGRAHPRTPPPQPPGQGTPPASPEESDVLSPDNRIAHVEQEAPEYSKEYRLRLLNRLLIRKIPLDQIASQLGVSVSTVKRDRAELHRRLRESASSLDANQMIGEAISFFGEIESMALRMATAAKTPTASKLAALRTALQGRKDMATFLQAAGVFDVLKFKAGEDTSNTDLARLVELAESVLEGEDEIVDSVIQDDEELADLYLL